MTILGRVRTRRVKSAMADNSEGEGVRRSVLKARWVRLGRDVEGGRRGAQEEVRLLSEAMWTRRCVRDVKER